MMRLSQVSEKGPAVFVLRTLVLCSGVVMGCFARDVVSERHRFVNCKGF